MVVFAIVMMMTTMTAVVVECDVSAVAVAIVVGGRRVDLD